MGTLTPRVLPMGQNNQVFFFALWVIFYPFIPKPLYFVLRNLQISNIVNFGGAMPCYGTCKLVLSIQWIVFATTYHYWLLEKLINRRTVKSTKVNTAEVSLLPEGSKVNCDQWSHLHSQPMWFRSFRSWSIRYRNVSYRMSIVFLKNLIPTKILKLNNIRMSFTFIPQAWQSLTSTC